MLIAILVLTCALFAFVGASFFLTYKTYEFEVEGNKLKIQNVAAHLKLFINDALVEDHYMPQLIKGEEYKLKLGERDIVLRCKSSALGYKMRVELEENGEIFADNGVKLKEKKSKNKEEKHDEPSSNDEGKIIY